MLNYIQVLFFSSNIFLIKILSTLLTLLPLNVRLFFSYKNLKHVLAFPFTWNYVICVRAYQEILAIILHSRELINYMHIISVKGEGGEPFHIFLLLLITLRII